MPIAAVDFAIVRDLVRAQSGIVLAPGSEYLVEARLTPLVREVGLRCLGDLVQKLRESRGSPLHKRVVEAMTTNETSFFRDIHPFETLRQHVLPELIRKRSAERKLSLWCAAASSGQEPYSIAMLLREHFAELRHWQLSFLATDLSTEMLELCREGVFSRLEVGRGLPANLKSRYFEPKGEAWQISQDLRSLIEFKPLNLTEVWPKLPRFDLVFMRNVLIYFDNATKQKILNRTRAQLAPDGLLFLGSTETTLKIDDEFEPVRVDKSAFFRVRSAASKAALPGTSQAAPRASRTHTRFAVPCFASLRLGAKSGRGIIADLSQSGARLDRPTPALAVGDRIALGIQLLDGEAPIEVECRVVRATSTGVGVEFAPGSPGLLRLAECLVLRTAAPAKK